MVTDNIVAGNCSLLDIVHKGFIVSSCVPSIFIDKSPEKPHHRPSVASDAAVCGMLVGGPNSDFKNNGGDSIATTKLKDKNPDECYIDNENSWSTNEVTIYWNSPLIFMLGYIQ